VDALPSTSAFKFILRRYSEVACVPAGPSAIGNAPHGAVCYSEEDAVLLVAVPRGGGLAAADWGWAYNILLATSLDRALNANNVWTDVDLTIHRKLGLGN